MTVLINNVSYICLPDSVEYLNVIGQWLHLQSNISIINCKTYLTDDDLSWLLELCSWLN